MSNWSVYTLHRFMQYKDRSVHSLRAQEHGHYIGVIFSCGDAEIHDLRKEPGLAASKALLRCRNVVDLCFVSIPTSSIVQNKSVLDTSSIAPHVDGDSADDDKTNALLVAVQHKPSDFVRLLMYIEYDEGGGWREIAVSIEMHNKMFKQRARKLFEIPVTSLSGYILRGHGHIVAMCSEHFSAIYVWRILVNKHQHQASLISPICIDIGMASQIYCMVVTKHALFASDRQCIRISPAPSVLWNGQLELKVPKIYKLSVITSQLVAGISESNQLLIFGVDRKNQNFKAFFVSVSTPLPVAHCTSFPLDDGCLNNEEDRDSEAMVKKKKKADDQEMRENVKDKNVNMMGWNANKYMLCLKTPTFPQLFVVILDSLFVQSLLRSKETKRMVKLNNYPSKIVCTFANTMQIVPLYPDMLFIPNQHDIHAVLFTFK